MTFAPLRVIVPELLTSGPVLLALLPATILFFKEMLPPDPFQIPPPVGAWLFVIVECSMVSISLSLMIAPPAPDPGTSLP